jgi:hypothetical protein
MRAIPLALLICCISPLSGTEARAAESWCANYGTGHSGSDCSFTSFAQCQATLSGLSGFCQPNPFPNTNFGRSGTWGSGRVERARPDRAER